MLKTLVERGTFFTFVQVGVKRESEIKLLLQLFLKSGHVGKRHRVRLQTVRDLLNS